MADTASRAPRVALLSRQWHDVPHGSSGEAAFVHRAVAGAAARYADVEVLVPGPAGAVQADGLFDVRSVGTPSGHAPQDDVSTRTGVLHWPEPDAVVWPTTVEPEMVVRDAGDADAATLARRFAPDAHQLLIVDTVVPPAARTTALVVGAASRRGLVGFGWRDGDIVEAHPPVAVNRLAAEGRHNAIGGTDYVLVLTDRAGRPEPSPPTPAAAWLTARFPARDIVVVESASAAVWRGRALRGVVAVDSRTDLWRLVAHAGVLVDLAPGALVARECVEALRFGIPIVVPDGTVAASLARAGGGLPFCGVAELLDGVERAGTPSVRGALGTRGRALAERLHGDADRFVRAVGGALAGAESLSGR